MNYERLQIFRPLISNRITQGFGENKACINPNTQAVTSARNGVCPAPTTLFYPWIGMNGHNGYDIKALVGEDVYHAATFKGWMHTETDYAGGIGVDVISNEPLFFEGEPPKDIAQSAVTHTQGGVRGYTHHVKMRYWHLKAPIGHEKKEVTCGTTIGLAGNTGASSGPHLHFAPKWCHKDGRNAAPNNRFNGAFDPTPYYLHETTAREHSEYTAKVALPLTEQEVKDIKQQLTLLQQLLVTLQKFKHNI